MGLKRGMGNRRVEKIFTMGLLDFYSSPHIIRIIKVKIITWAVHVACMGENRNTCRVFVEKPEGNGPLAMPDEKGRIILK